MKPKVKHRTSHCSVKDCGNEYHALGYCKTHYERFKRYGRIELKPRHGRSKTKLYKKYYSMKERCFNEKSTSYPNYGGRGIKVCDEWKNSFASFLFWATLHNYWDGASIERIDNEGDYCPSNCRWIDRGSQNRNTRNSRVLDCHGKTMLLCDWADYLGISVSTILTRIRRGWKIEDALDGRRFRTNGVPV